MAKRRIRQNRYDNWYGYEGGRKVASFFNDAQGTQEEHANRWLRGEPAIHDTVPQRLRLRRRTK